MLSHFNRHVASASARQEFYLIHGSHRIPQWASNHVTLASWGPGWPVTPRQTKRGPRCIPKKRLYLLLTLVNRRRSGKLTMFLGEYYHHIGFFSMAMLNYRIVYKMTGPMTNCFRQNVVQIFDKVTCFLLE